MNSGVDRQECSIVQRDENRKQMNERVFKLVEQNLKKGHDKNVKTHNLRHKKFAATYQVGQTVLKKNFRLPSAADHYNAKYGPLYLPCVVVARRGTSCYELVDENGKNLGVFSAADLRPDN